VLRRVALANAALYSSTAELAQQLQQALQSRAVIDQAKGIIMAELRCNPDDAFTYLTTLSQDQNRRSATSPPRSSIALNNPDGLGLVTTVGDVRRMQLQRKPCPGVMARGHWNKWSSRSRRPTPLHAD